MCSIQFDQGLNRLCYMLNGELLNDLRLPAVDTKTEIILGYIGPILIRVFSLTHMAFCCYGYWIPVLYKFK